VIRTSLAILSLCLTAFATTHVGSAAELDTAAKAELEKIAAALPVCEAAADACERDLATLDPSGRFRSVAIDNATALVEATRSLRGMIAQRPEYVARYMKTRPNDWRDAMTYFLDCARKDVDPYAGYTSGNRSFRSRIDGHLLVYQYRLPPKFDPAGKYALQIYLHSAGGMGWPSWGVYGKPTRNTSGCDRITVSFCGRGDNSYSAMGEVAVLEEIEDIRKHYPIDEDRIYLGGSSMGGTGSMRIAVNHPDLFAAVSSLTGGTCFGLEPGHGRFDALTCIENLFNSPLCIWDAPKEGWWTNNHGLCDTMRAQAAKHPGYFNVLELTDPEGKHGGIDPKLQKQGSEWIVQQKRNRYPRMIFHRTYTLRYATSHWLGVDMMDDPTALAQIEAMIADDGVLTVTTTNIRRFHIQVPKEVVGTQAAMSVAIDGAGTLTAAVGEPVNFRRSATGWSVAKERFDQGLVKKPGLSGPVVDAFMEHPLLMVYGTLQNRDRGAADAMIDKVQLSLWGPPVGAKTHYAKGERRADTAVSAADIAERNLILFGTPATNTFLRDIAASLPVAFSADGVRIGEQTFAGPGVGLAMIYPNPKNPERYILILPEDYQGGSPLYFPDWVVLKGAKPMAKGDFGNAWGLPLR
jgi:pimeloyl-ACP methyl ester carboxylesterase